MVPAMKVDTRLLFADLVDVPKLQALLESFNQVIGIANAVIDVDGAVIARAGWQAACTDFHRVHPESCRRCIESDTALVEHMTQGAPYAVYECLNGLVDTAAPVVVSGQHVANVFTGQVLTAPPDLAFFRSQAQRFDFDEGRYLDAIARVPVVPLARVKAVTQLYAQLAGLLADNGMDRLRQRQATEGLTRLNAELEARVASRTEDLTNSEERLRLALDTARQGWFDLDLASGATVVSPQYAKLLGYEPAEFNSSLDNWLDNIHPDDRPGVHAALDRALATDITADVEYRRQTRLGDWIWLSSVGRVVARDGAGKPLRMIGIHRDISQRKQAEASIRRQNEYLQTIFATEPECVKVVSTGGFLEDMNPAGLRMLEVDSLDEAQRAGLLEFVDPAYRKAFGDLHKSVCGGQPGILEFPITGRKGTVRWLETHATPLHDEQGKVLGLLGVTRDITERKRFQQELEQQARIDYLTHLNNRGYFMQLAEQELLRTRRYGGDLAIFMLDIDFFKQINDSRGHKAGDVVLRKLAETCRSALREVDVVGRYGGEEFVVLLPETGIDEAAEVAERLRAAVADARFSMDSGLPIHITVSIGVTALASPEENLDVLLDQADTALYEAKSGGRNKVCRAAK